MQDLQPLIKNLMGFAQKRMGFSHPPKLFLKQDAENSKNILGKTAYYDPERESVTIFVSDRHPKDILRSIAHELVHHTQNLRGDLAPEKCGSLGPGYAQEDSHMREMERQAYEQGNMCFRDWEDKCKKQLEEVKFLKESKKMAIKISKNELKNLIGKLLKKRINEQKDEFYGRTGADRISSNLDDYEYDRGVEADDDIRRQRARLDKYEREQAGIARDKKEFARQDAENKAFAMGKKWSMGKDYRGRKAPDFSRAKSRRIAYREATRNRMPIFVYKGKSFTTKFAKKAKKLPPLDPKIPAQDRPIVDKARRSGALKALRNVEDDPAMQALYRPFSLEEMVRKEISERMGAGDHRTDKFFEKQKKDGNECQLRTSTGRYLNGKCVPIEDYNKATKTNESIDEGGCGSHKKDDKKVLDEKEGPCCGLSAKEGCPGPGQPHPDNLSVKIKENEEVDEQMTSPDAPMSVSTKPDFPDVDGDGDTKEPISKASKEKKEKEGDDPKKESAKPKNGKVPPQLRKHVQKKKEGQNESKIFTPEQEQELYESRFNNRNEQIFDTLKKLWTK